MNALFWIGLALVAILTVIFFVAIFNGRGGLCIACFLLVAILACAGILTSFLPPKVTTWTITNISKKQVMTLFNEESSQNLSLPLKSVNHINAEYKVDTKVEIWQTIWGEIIYVSPEKWTVIGK